MIYMCVLQWVTARDRFCKAAELMDAEQRMKKSMWGQFWSAHQRFFKYLCISAKVNHCVEIAREAVKNGKVNVQQMVTGKKCIHSRVNLCIDY